MSPQRVASLLKEGSGLWLIDVRREADFSAEHIEGAVHIPASLLGTKRVPKGKVLILVDDSLGLRKAREGAELLLKSGHDKVFLLDGGMLAWLGERLPVAGRGNPWRFRSVMPDDIDWAMRNGVAMRIFDLRELREKEKGPVPQARPVEGKTLTARLENLKKILSVREKKGLAEKLEKPATVVLVLPIGSDPRSALERALRGVPGDIRYFEGGYAAWAAKPDKSVTTVGTCPTCPKGTVGGKI